MNCGIAQKSSKKDDYSHLLEIVKWILSILKTLYGSMRWARESSQHESRDLFNSIVPFHPTVKHHVSLDAGRMLQEEEDMRETRELKRCLSM